MKCVLLGAKGQVGSEIVTTCPNDFQLLAYGREELDISSKDQVSSVLGSEDFDLVINAAGYTSVDRAESEQESAYQVNRDGAENVALLCHERNIPLIHLSTDYVFDGAKDGEYQEGDTLNPLGIYGLSKYQGEEAIRHHIEHYLIVRVSWVFGANGKNFVRTMLHLAQEQEELKVVADQYGCPTPARDIAELIWDLVRKVDAGEDVPWGTYHYRGDPPTTWYSFAEAIIRTAGDQIPLKVKRVLPISTQEYPTPAKRPVNSVLSCQKLSETFGVHPKPWQQGLTQVIRDWTN